MQQIGASLGIALLSTLSAGATTSYLAGKPANAGVVAQATVHGYAVAFWCAAAIFAAGAIVCGPLLRSGALQPEPRPSPAPAAWHETPRGPMRATPARLDGPRPDPMT